MTRRVLCVLAVTGLIGIGSFVRAAEEKADGWVSLFGGKDLSGWKFRNPNAKKTWGVFADAKLQADNDKRLIGTGEGEAGKGAMLSGDDGKGSDIITEKSFGDCELHAEFMMAKGSNSGIYFTGLYEVQVFDSWGKTDKDLKYGDVGGVYDHKAPSTNVSKAPGEWQTFDIVFRAARFDAAGKKTENAKFVWVKLNGTEIQKDVEVLKPTTSNLGGPEKSEGPLMLQGDHGPVAFRNVRIRAVVGGQ